MACPSRSGCLGENEVIDRCVGWLLGAEFYGHHLAESNINAMIILLLAAVVLVPTVMALAKGKVTELLFAYAALGGVAMAVVGLFTLFNPPDSAPPSWYGLIMTPVGIALLIIVAVLNMRREHSRSQ